MEDLAEGDMVVGDVIEDVEHEVRPDRAQLVADGEQHLALLRVMEGPVGIEGMRLDPARPLIPAPRWHRGAGLLGEASELIIAVADVPGPRAMGEFDALDVRMRLEHRAELIEDLAEFLGHRGVRHVDAVPAVDALGTPVEARLRAIRLDRRDELPPYSK